MGNRFGAYNEATNETTPFNFPGPMAPSSVLREGDTVYIGCKEEFGVYDLRYPREPLQDYFVYHMNSYLQDIHFDRFHNVWAVENRKNNVSVYWQYVRHDVRVRHPDERLAPDLPVHRQPGTPLVRGKRAEQAWHVPHGTVQLFRVRDAGHRRQRSRSSPGWRPSATASG